MTPNPWTAATIAPRLFVTDSRSLMLIVFLRAPNFQSAKAVMALDERDRRSAELEAEITRLKRRKGPPSQQAFHMVALPDDASPQRGQGSAKLARPAVMYRAAIVLDQSPRARAS